MGIMIWHKSNMSGCSTFNGYSILTSKNCFYRWSKTKGNLALGHACKICYAYIFFWLSRSAIFVEAAILLSLVLFYKYMDSLESRFFVNFCLNFLSILFPSE